MKTRNTKKAQQDFNKTDCSHTLQVFTEEMDSSYEKYNYQELFIIWGILSLKIFIVMFFKT